MTNTNTIGFIGAGNMATSLIKGLVAKNGSADNLWASDIDIDKVTALAKECGITAMPSETIATNADVIVLAVKPQVMKVVCEYLRSHLKDDCLIVSIAAGISSSQLEQWLQNGDKHRRSIVRCMPNTPALVGSGATGLYANYNTTSEQKQLAQAILQAVGIAVWVEQESGIDAVTAVSGSGPAYFFLFMEAMQAAGQDMGLSADMAKALTLQTALGAAQLALASSDSTEELRRKVTSPGGTTEQAINSFETGGLRTLVDTALKAAQQRSVELATELGD